MCNNINIGNSAPQRDFIQRLRFMGGTYRTILIIVCAAEASLERSLFPK